VSRGALSHVLARTAHRHVAIPAIAKFTFAVWKSSKQEPQGAQSS
jgi:hypothetical protein